jgi:hypothetical protein
MRHAACPWGGMPNERDEQGFSAEGAVVEILERGGERFARILIEPHTVLELPAGSMDVSLGDRVSVDASLNVTRVRPGPRAAPAAAEGQGPETRARFRDYAHVWRMAGVFAAALVLFLGWRSWMVPSDFGVYGHYRAGAIVQAAAHTPRFAGQKACIDCHTDAQELRAGGGHKAVACEACHGALGQHARGETDVAPIRPSTRAVCLSCHTTRVGMPAPFPKIVVKEHSDAGPCTDCHASHKPAAS